MFFLLFRVRSVFYFLFAMRGMLRDMWGMTRDMSGMPDICGE